MNRTVTLADYLAVFDDWFRVIRENSYVGTDAESEADFRAAVAEGGLPDVGTVRDFCAVLAPRIKSRGRLWFAIYKSNFLARRLYNGEALRTEKCPEHGGHWSGIDFGPASGSHCAHGCHLTGWLPAGSPK